MAQSLMRLGWRPKKLTPRLRQALLSIARGEPIKITADEMGVAFRTAAKHRQWALEFFGAHSKVEAVVKALKRGEIQLSEI